MALVKPTNEEGVREALDTIGVSGEEIQQVSNPVFGNNVFQIQTRELGPSQVKNAKAALAVQVRHRQERLRKHQRRADLRRTGRQQRPEGADLLAVGDLPPTSPSASTPSSRCRS